MTQPTAPNNYELMVNQNEIMDRLISLAKYMYALTEHEKDLVKHTQELTDRVKFLEDMLIAKEADK